MPELPEVETIRLGLEKYLVGHTITGIAITLPKIFQGDSGDILNAKIIGVRRFGKGLVIDLENNFCIAIHIKLTGQLIYKKNEKIDKKEKNQQKTKVIKDLYSNLPNKWTHVIFSLDNNATLFYNDFRQFGWIKVIANKDLKKIVFFKELGPEFFKDLNEEVFISIIKKSHSAIKSLLLEQKKMSGVGNIYANDALNLAKIDPRKKASSLTEEEGKTLYAASETVLKKGLQYGGASELSFVNALGEEGTYQEHFLTYGRTGKQCFNCQGTIERITLGGRGTFFCPDCQK